MNERTPISEILSRLMFKRKIRAAELARLTGVPQPTVHRLSTGVCPNPHHSSLVPIAEFFNISVNQLKGLEPITEIQGFDDELVKQVIHSLPIITWDEARRWQTIPKKEDGPRRRIITDKPVSSHAFALVTKDSAMEPIFPKDSILIIDPDKKPKDRHFVVVVLENYPEVIFRQLIVNAQSKFIKVLSPDLSHAQMTELTDRDRVVGVMIEARQEFDL